jgi:hypothetical protein
MKALIFAAGLIVTATALAETRVIPPPEAKDHVGEIVTVEGAVSEVHHAAFGKATFVDMGGHYPNNSFAGVLFSGDEPKFPDIDSLEGKTIDISGVVKLYQGRPEIILNDPEQIKVK